MTALSKLIEDTALRIPDLPAMPRKNLYDILGVRNKEVINSRVLGYFLDPEEDHGFGLLFFDALMELIQQKQEAHKPQIDLDNYYGSFEVSIEELTKYAAKEEDQLKRIDLFLKGEDYCIIIENKLYHHLANPLDVYWQHAGKTYKENKIAILLTLFPAKEDECKVNENLIYINITHQEWMKTIQENLRIDTSLAEIDLFYLREYFKTIESHYTHKKDEGVMNEIVNALVQQRTNILNIQKKTEEALAFLEREIEEVFESFGYEKEEQWYVKKIAHSDLYFWVESASHILEENRLWFCYEAWYSTKENLKEDKISTHLNKMIKPNKRIKFGVSSHYKDRFHIAEYDHKDFLNPSDSFKKKFTSVLADYFFNDDGIVNQTIDFLKKTS